MRIAFDARPWSGPPTSFGRTLSCLVQGAEAAGLEAELWLDGPPPPEHERLAARAADALLWSEAPARTRADVLWSTESSPPPLPRAAGDLPVVLTLYDVHPLLPDGRARIVRWKRHRRFRAQVQRAAAAAARLMTVSAWSRSSIEAAFPELAGRASVVPLFADRTSVAAALPGHEARARLAAAGLRPGYVLFVGSLRRHKNWDGLLAAHAALPERLAAEHPLVLAGAARRARDEALRRARELGVADRFRLLGEVDDALLRALYAGAAALAHVSLFEGFGLTPLEAMAHGVPVVASDRAALPEVLGDAPRYVDPADGPAIARALEALLTDEAERGRRAAAGLARAGEYGPERTGAAMRGLLAALGVGAA